MASPMWPGHQLMVGRHTRSLREIYFTFLRGRRTATSCQMGISHTCLCGYLRINHRNAYQFGELAKVRNRSMENSGGSRVSRRKALGILGAGAGSGLLIAATPLSKLIAGTLGEERSVMAHQVIPDGAIVRTIFADLAPEDLATGRTLFHEHLSAAYSRTALQPAARGHRAPCMLAGAPRA